MATSKKSRPNQIIDLARAGVDLVNDLAAIADPNNAADVRKELNSLLLDIVVQASKMATREPVTISGPG